MTFSVRFLIIKTLTRIESERDRMVDLSDKQLLEIVDELTSWGSKVSELWLGTQYEKQIDMHQAQMVKAVEAKDFKKIQKFVYDFARLLDRAENDYKIGY